MLKSSTVKIGMLNFDNVAITVIVGHKDTAAQRDPSIEQQVYWTHWRESTT